MKAATVLAARPPTLVVFCHPDPASFCAALHTTVLDALQRSGTPWQGINLYESDFDPCLGRDEWRHYSQAGAALPAALLAHVQALRAAEHLVFVFPVWMAGPPALLKGWFDRVWRPGVAFLRPLRPGGLPRPGLLQVRRITVVTTSNAPRWWTWLQGDPNRRLFTRALRAFCAPRCRVRWLQAHAVQRGTAADREAFKARVSQAFLVH